MLDTKYGLKYSMPHSVVHLVDNSTYAGQLPSIIVDDPSLYASIVVTGCPMGADNEVISINRSDVLNVAYKLGNLSAGDINKYGQSITYPASLLRQDVPIKFMRVTPPGSTYAFSCLLIQWRWDPVNSVMHVRYKTTSGNHNNGLPIGVVHSNFKNPARLNAALVRGFANDAVDENDGTGTWKQRVFMTVISAGRGKEYNFFNYSINQTQQSKRPSNVRYLFSTIDTRTNTTVETFYGSLVNQNNSNTVDTIPTANVVVNQRVKGSSILVPTINEDAVNELFNEYMHNFKQCMNNNILPPSAGGNIEYVKDVYVTTTANIFDPIYGRYIYNGDTEVKLPYFQVDMFDLDIPKLDPINRISIILDEGVDAASYVNNPVDLYKILNDNTYGVENMDDTYHVGDIFTQDTQNPTLSLITTINQYTGAVTSIPITSITVPAQKTTVTNDDGEEEEVELTKQVDEIFRGCVTINGEATSASLLTTGINDLIAKKKLAPRKDNITGAYYVDPIIVIDSSKKTYTWTIAFVCYKDKVDGTGKVIGSEYDETTTKILTKNEIYAALVYPSNAITSFAIRETDVNWNTPGSTIIDIEGKYDETGDGNVGVYVNGYNASETDKDLYTVDNTDSFMIGVCPTSIAITKDIVNTSYDAIIYENSADATWSVTAVNVPSGLSNESKNYTVGSKVTVTGLDNTQFRVTEVDANGKVLGIDVYSSNETVKILPGTYNAVEVDPPTEDGSGNITSPIGLKVIITAADITANIPSTVDPTHIQRYVVSGTQGSIYRIASDITEIPSNYYSSSYGINPSSEMGGVPVEGGYAGFFDDDISEIEYKWKYSELLVNAFRGKIDPRIQSPTRVSAKFLFDGGFNTIVGQTILPYMTYKPIDIINASTIYTEDEKESILLDNTLIANIKDFADIDVKQAMYDLMEYRCYAGIPDDKRPIGYGSGLSLHLDSGETDAKTALLVNQSFAKRFKNPNASWDIGGYVSSVDGISYTYIKKIVDNLFSHIKQYSINKPFTGKYTNISQDQYIGFFPDIDTTDWEMRELLYKSGGNAWIMDVNGNLQRKSQRTLYRDGDTSDLIQESNMRTLSQLVYLLQNKIDSYLLEYNDDGILKTLKDDCDNMFTNWIGNLVQALDIQFQRDINPVDGGEIVVCYCSVTFRGLILRVPIIVNVNRRTDSE